MNGEGAQKGLEEMEDVKNIKISRGIQVVTEYHVTMATSLNPPFAGKWKG